MFSTNIVVLRLFLRGSSERIKKFLIMEGENQELEKKKLLFVISAFRSSPWWRDFVYGKDVDLIITWPLKPKQSLINFSTLFLCNEFIIQKFCDSNLSSDSEIGKLFDIALLSKMSQKLIMVYHISSRIKLLIRILY